MFHDTIALTHNSYVWQNITMKKYANDQNKQANPGWMEYLSVIKVKIEYINFPKT